jgi:hypothetical protein
MIAVARQQVFAEAHNDEAERTELTAERDRLGIQALEGDW